MVKQVHIDPISLVPLFLETRYHEANLGAATGFAIQKDNNFYLVTNWHVLSGRNPMTNQPISGTGVAPDSVAIWHHIKGKLGNWGRKLVALKKTDGSPTWLELRQADRVIDVAALSLPLDDEVQLYPLDLGLANTDLMLSPSEPVSIVGFPFGLSSGGKFPIWKTGHIASDIDLDYDGQPVFLTDATTKPGMSGSPVIARRTGMQIRSNGISLGGGEAIRFLGVFSGHIHGESEIGMVWKPDTINLLINRSNQSSN